MKIYTRTGDQGTTGLFGGGRVPKDHVRIEAYGAVDEVNALIGVVRSRCKEDDRLDGLDEILRGIQSELFVLGADLATPTNVRVQVPRIRTDHVDRLERLIDVHEDEVEPLRNFVLPAGTAVAALLHHARTVARRCERAVVRAAKTEHLREETIIYLNRLSDLLFVLARWANARSGTPDDPWFHEE